jgi:hypothetical protein
VIESNDFLARASVRYDTRIGTRHNKFQTIMPLTASERTFANIWPDRYITFNETLKLTVERKYGDAGQQADR